MWRWLALSAWALAGASGCKVPISGVDARFRIADASWFEDEQTLFVFYDVEAAQGISEDSVLEIRYETDDGAVDWIALDALTQVHPHEAVDCGANRLCGSGSLAVPLEPRSVALRMRYHVDGELSLRPDTVFNVVASGPPHRGRSLVIYGVFDETNRAVQWRARHRFPTVRNEEAERLGLRRRFQIDTQRAAEVPVSESNRYLYGADCEGVALEMPTLETVERAAFQPEDLPQIAAESPAVCARSVVEDAVGAFEAVAVARKNPEVRPAFPLLRSPTVDATPIKYLLQFCDRDISSDHLQMQRQRLQLEGVEAICVEGWREDDTEDALVARMQADIDAVRAEGQDMMLVMALHHNERAFSAMVESVISRVMAGERDRNTPRVAGVFVLDSYPYRVERADVAQTTLWCPASIGETGQASEDCAIPDFSLSLSLGPLSTSVLPILPSRSMLLDFLETYTETQAGEVQRLEYRVPTRPAVATHVELEEDGLLFQGGLATFFNDESISADADDAFSICEPEERRVRFAFRPGGEAGDVLPLEVLPGWHADARDTLVGDTAYGLGLIWDFPFSLEIEYVLGLATGVSAFSFSVPIGIPIDVEEDFGSGLWFRESFSLASLLLQCRRFCDHPTFDSAGVYQVTARFDIRYAYSCYRPLYPARGDGGFPIDP